MLLKLPLIYNIIKRNVSALYITGDKANQNCAVLTPYFDFNTKLHNTKQLEQNIKNRNLQIDLHELHELWSTYKDIEMRKTDLLNKRAEIAILIRNIKANQDGSEDLIRKYSTEGVMVREDLKSLKKNSYALEDIFVHKFLELPNDIHERTPIEEDEIVSSHFDQQAIGDGENHLNQLNYIEYHDPYCYYLKSDAAKFDLHFPPYCLDVFRSYGFMPFSNPDFIKSIIAEGAGFTPEGLLGVDDEDIDNKLNLLHLVGNGSMLSFLGFVTKWLVYKHSLPLKFVSIGKDYSLPKSDSSETGLYSSSQTTNVHLFAMTSNESESLQQFDEILEQMVEFYKRFEMPFRVSYVSSGKLRHAENLRVNFEMYSPHRKCYISIGHLSSYGDYISKRLLVSYREEKSYKFPYLISGTVINVTRFLAILLEREGVLSTTMLFKGLK